jgi:hypothetical protein
VFIYEHNHSDHTQVDLSLAEQHGHSAPIRDKKTRLGSSATLEASFAAATAYAQTDENSIFSNNRGNNSLQQRQLNES